MGWADLYISKLSQGDTIQFRPRGNSMAPKICSGQLVTVVPIDRDCIIGDIVLCKVRGRQYLHLVKATKEDSVLIGNNRGRLNGWTNIKNVYGRCTGIE